MKKNMMTAAALMMAAIALTACGKEEQTASPAAENLMNVEVISTEATAAETAISSDFMSSAVSEAVTEAMTELQTEAAQTVASSAQKAAVKKQVTEKKTTVKTEKKQSETKKTENQDTAEQKSESAKEAKQNTPAEEPQIRPLTDDEHKEIAKSMIESYCYVTDRLIFGEPLPTDDEVKTVRIEGKEYDVRYRKITVPNQYGIASTEDLKWQIGQVLTGNEYDKAVNTVMEGTCDPIFSEFDGELYLAEIGKGTLYGDWLWDTMTISNVTDKGFTAELQMRSYGDMINRCSFEFTDVALGAPFDFRVSNYVCV